MRDPIRHSGVSAPQPDAAARFSAMFEAHSRPLLAYALRRTERPADAADVVSETMLVAWRRLDEVPGGAETRPWLFGVTRRVLSNHYRSERRGTRLGERLRESLAEVEIADHAEAVGTRTAVREALLRLDEDDRELLCLTAWEGLGPGAIAVAMSVPAATVRTRLHRARARLRQELEAAGFEGGGEWLLAKQAEAEA